MKNRAASAGLKRKKKDRPEEEKADTISADDIPVELGAEHRNQGIVVVESAIKTRDSLSPFKATDRTESPVKRMAMSMAVPNKSSLLA